jgi:hypothetical protein
MANEFKIKKGLIVTGASGGTVVDIQGSQGQLFSVTDDLSGSIFAVSDISGVPIFDVNSNGISYFDGSLGVGTDSPKGKLHVLNGTAGTYTPDSESDTLVIESATPGGISLIGTGTGSASKQSITFGTTSDTTSARIIYNSNSSFLSIGTTTVSNFVKFVSGNGVTALTLDATQNAIFAGNINLPTAKYLRFTSAASGSSGTVLFGNTTGTGGDLTFKRNSDTASMFKITGSGNAEVTGKGTSAATISSDGSSTLTTKGYVDSLITGATIYRGAWDPSGGGYGSPDLSTVTQTSGYYYICSAAGTAEPNGTGTEPDTWETGDWVIYNDVSGTGQWQKIDNSSVLSGVGTGQTVALWEGAGSVTDSETLGNAPITVSGNNSTFAGNVTLSSTAPILYLDNTTATTGENWRLSSAANGKMYIAQDGVVDAITLDHTSGNATFAGTVTSPTFLGDLNGTINTATTGTTQTAGNNSTLIATTAYADAAAAAVPIGNYLPLTGGTLTGNTNLTGSTKKLILQSGAQLGFEDAAPTGTIYLYNDGAATSRLNIGGTMWVEEAGNVGIGVTGPTTHLEVVASQSNSSIRAGGLEMQSYAVNNSWYAENLYYDGGWKLRSAGAATQMYMQAGKITFNRFVVGAAGDFVTPYPTMILASNGKVGINETGPSAQLQVASSGSNGSAGYSDYGILTTAGGSGQATIGVMHDGDGYASLNLGSNVSSSNVFWHISKRVAASTDFGGNNGLDYFYYNGSSFTNVFGFSTAGNFKAAGSIQMADDTDTASATKVGTMRYRTGTEYVEVDGVDLANGWTFTSGWNAFGGGTSITNSTTFVSESGQGIFAGLGLTTSKTYKVVIAGTQPSGGYISIKAGTTGTSFGNISEQSFDKVLYATLTTVSGNTNSFYIRLADHTSNTSIVITKLEIQEVTAEDASYADMCMQTGASTYEWVNIVRNTY